MQIFKIHLVVVVVVVVVVVLVVVVVVVVVVVELVVVVVLAGVIVAVVCGVIVGNNVDIAVVDVLVIVVVVVDGFGGGINLHKRPPINPADKIQEIDMLHVIIGKQHFFLCIRGYFGMLASRGVCGEGDRGGTGDDRSLLGGLLPIVRRSFL
jgi:hypothetical protein